MAPFPSVLFGIGIFSSAAVPALQGLSWAKIGDQGIDLGSFQPAAVPAQP